MVTFLSGDQFHIIRSNKQTPFVQFFCNATGYPNLHIQWYQNDNLIPSDSRDFEIENGTDTNEKGLILAHSVIQAKDPKLAHSGKITCQASIRYQREENGEKGKEAQTSSSSLFRDLIVLGIATYFVKSCFVVTS